MTLWINSIRFFEKAQIVNLKQFYTKNQIDSKKPIKEAYINNPTGLQFDFMNIIVFDYMQLWIDFK